MTAYEWKQQKRFHPVFNRVALLKRDVTTNLEGRLRPQGEVFVLTTGFENGEYRPDSYWRDGYANPAMHYSSFDSKRLGFYAFGMFYGDARPSGYPSEWTNGEGMFYSIAAEPEFFTLYCPSHDMAPDCCGCQTNV